MVSCFCFSVVLVLQWFHSGSTGLFHGLKYFEMILYDGLLIVWVLKGLQTHNFIVCVTFCAAFLVMRDFGKGFKIVVLKVGTFHFAMVSKTIGNDLLRW